MDKTTPHSPGPHADRAAQHDDTLAMNDIHAVLTSPSLTGDSGDALQAIADILARTGRSPYPSRIITATVEDGPHGIPLACVDAEGTIVTVSQDPAGPGIRIDIAPRDPADEAALVIAVSDRIIHRTRPAGLRSISRPAGQS
jgi:hypothetical protein